MKNKLESKSKSKVIPPSPLQLLTRLLTWKLTFPQTIQDCARYPMGSNKVTESLRHNDNLFDLPLNRETSNGTGCNHFVQAFSCMCILSASKSAAMAARVLEWPAEIGARAVDLIWQFERYIKLLRCQDDVLATIEVANYVQACGSVVLVVRTAGYESSFWRDGMKHTAASVFI